MCRICLRVFDFPVRVGEGKAIRMHLISLYQPDSGKSFPAILGELQSRVESGLSFPTRTGFASICSGFASICSGFALGGFYLLRCPKDVVVGREVGDEECVDEGIGPAHEERDFLSGYDFGDGGGGVEAVLGWS
ncbi:hypothetical protein Droror1_Dr00001762 [Drosera rotundifolia]